MNFKVSKVAYSKATSPADAIFPLIRKEVRAHLVENARSGAQKLWMKVVVLILLAASLFTTSLVSGQTWLIITSYILFGWVLVLLGFNLAHDAAHDCLPVSKRMNHFIFESTFALLGANPYLWKIRHIYSHHPYPNVEGCDSDIELTVLLRISDKQPRLKMHHFQHLYAPLLYATYTLYWIFYKDFILFFRKKQANIFFHSHPVKEWIKLFVYKGAYFFILLGIPAIIQPGSIGIYFLAFLLMHAVISVFIIFSFLISHHVPQTHSHGSFHEHSWLMQQITSSADFHAESNWAYWIFGGFNAHTAHHLFPRICHVHYPAVTRIIREKLQQHRLPYNSFSFIKGIACHLQFLRQKGKYPVNKCIQCKNKGKCGVGALVD